MSFDIKHVVNSYYKGFAAINVLHCPADIFIPTILLMCKQCQWLYIELAMNIAELCEFPPCTFYLIHRLDNPVYRAYYNKCIHNVSHILFLHRCPYLPTLHCRQCHSPYIESTYSLHYIDTPYVHRFCILLCLIDDVSHQTILIRYTAVFALNFFIVFLTINIVRNVN